MTKKLFILWLIIAALIFSTFSVYAGVPLIENIEQEKELAKERVNQGILTARETAADTAEKTLEAAEKKIDEERKAKAQAEAKAKREKYIEALALYIRDINGNVPSAKAFGMAASFMQCAEEYKIKPEALMAVAQNESTFYTDAVSSENFKGLMQTGDGLARNAGYAPSQLFDYGISIKVGSRYLRIKLDEFGDMRLALTAYNQGSGSVHSGNYSTGYADLALQRAETIESYVKAILKKS